MNKVDLKILSDIDCNVYVDNNLIAVVKQNKVEILSLCKGEYWVQCVCLCNPQYKIEQIVNLKNHKVLKLEFTELFAVNAGIKSNTSMLSYNEEMTYTNKEEHYSVLPLTLYDNVNSFSEGLASVKQNGKYGFIDKKGTVIVPLIYDNVNSFSEGLAIVGQNCKYGLIDKKGNIVLPLIYDYINESNSVIRPLNYKGDNVPGKGYVTVNYNGLKITVFQMIGRTFIDETNLCPFKTTEKLLEEVKSKIIEILDSEEFMSNLYEGLDEKKRDELGQFYTPGKICIQMIEQYDTESFSGKNILDPTAGSGNLLIAMLSQEDSFAINILSSFSIKSHLFITTTLGFPSS